MSGHLEWAERRYKDEVAIVSAKLRQMADEIDRDVAGDSSTAERVAHTIIWGVANSHLDAVIFAEGEIAKARMEADA